MDKNKNSEKNLSKLITYCKKYIPIIAISIICAIIGAILSLIGPDKLSEMTDLISGGLFSSIDMDGVKSIGISLIIIYAVSTVLNLSQGYIMATITQKVTRGLRSDISKKLNKLPMSYYNKNTKGDLLSRY